MRRIVRSRCGSALFSSRNTGLFFGLCASHRINRVFTFDAPLAARAEFRIARKPLALIQILFTNKFLYFKFPRLKKIDF